MSFEVSLEHYSGPLHLLLELIEKKELPITDISLAQVTDEYVTFVEAHEPPPEELADFLVVATRLLLIKSHEILPREEALEEESGPSLAAQLQLYQLFTKAAEQIEMCALSSSAAFGRAQADILKADGFVLPDGVNATSVGQAFHALLKQLEPFFKLQQAAIERVVSVKERLKEIHEALLSRARLTFGEVVKGSASKVDVVVSFLALLELVKHKTVRVMQSDQFGDIEIHRVD